MQVRRESTPPHDESFSVAIIASVRVALAAAALREAESAALASALSGLCAEARQRGYPAERMVMSLKQAWRTARRPTLVAPADWEALYRDALTESLEIFFGEAPR
jgi:hypothetical protein